MVQVREALRRWLKGDGERPIAKDVGVDRKTARRYITAAVELGVDRSGGEGQLTDELIGQVVERVRPHRPDGHGEVCVLPTMRSRGMAVRHCRRCGRRGCDRPSRRCSLITDPSWVSTIRHDELVRAARRLSVGTYRSLLDQWDGRTAVERLHALLLVVQGRNDRLQPPQQSELLVAAANDPTEYRLVDTGHLPHLEDPMTLGGHLLDWFDRTA